MLPRHVAAGLVIVGLLAVFVSADGAAPQEPETESPAMPFSVHPQNIRSYVITVKHAGGDKATTATIDPEVKAAHGFVVTDFVANSSAFGLGVPFDIDLLENAARRATFRAGWYLQGDLGVATVPQATCLTAGIPVKAGSSLAVSVARIGAGQVDITVCGYVW